MFSFTQNENRTRLCYLPPLEAARAVLRYGSVDAFAKQCRDVCSQCPVKDLNSSKRQNFLKLNQT